MSVLSLRTIEAAYNAADALNNNFDEIETAVNNISNASTAVYNNSGGALAIGDAVYVTGYDTTEEKPTIAKADADGTGTLPAIGVVASAMNDTESGTVTSFGLVSGFDTSSWTAGDCLFLHTTAGEMTSTKPGSGFIQKIGVVVYSHATAGVIWLVPNIIDIDTQC